MPLHPLVENLFAETKSETAEDKFDKFRVAIKEVDGPESQFKILEEAICVAASKGHNQYLNFLTDLIYFDRERRARAYAAALSEAASSENIEGIDILMGVNEFRYNEILKEESERRVITEKMIEPAIYIAAESGKEKSLQALLKFNSMLPHFTIRSEAVETAIKKAATNGHAGCIQLLLGLHGYPQFHEKALKEAAKSGHSECVALLLKPYSRSGNFHEELSLAAAGKSENHKKCVEVIITKNPDSGLRWAASNNQSSWIIFALGLGADVNKKGYYLDSRGSRELTALMLTIEQNAVEAFDRLLSLSKNTSEAKAGEQKATVRALDVNAKDSAGNTALMLAVLSPKKPTGDRNYFVKQLIKHGADKNIRNDDKKTAYDLALSELNLEAMQLCKTMQQILGAGTTPHFASDSPLASAAKDESQYYYTRLLFSPDTEVRMPIDLAKKLGLQ